MLHHLLRLSEHVKVNLLFQFQGTVRVQHSCSVLRLQICVKRVLLLGHLLVLPQILVDLVHGFLQSLAPQFHLERVVRLVQVVVLVFQLGHQVLEPSFDLILNEDVVSCTLLAHGQLPVVHEQLFDFFLDSLKLKLGFRHPLSAFLLLRALHLLLLFLLLAPDWLAHLAHVNVGGVKEEDLPVLVLVELHVHPEDLHLVQLLDVEAYLVTHLQAVVDGLILLQLQIICAKLTELVFYFKVVEIVVVVHEVLLHRLSRHGLAPLVPVKARVVSRQPQIRTFVAQRIIPSNSFLVSLEHRGSELEAELPADSYFVLERRLYLGNALPEVISVSSLGKLVVKFLVSQDLATVVLELVFEEPEEDRVSIMHFRLFLSFRLLVVLVN